MLDTKIEFSRLTDVPVDDLMRLLNEPRNVRHMPLSELFTEETTALWAASKNEQWELHGYGPWAVSIDSNFAGWCGFQSEEDGADYALVLRPEYWGHGAAITEAAMEIGFGTFGLSEVVIALPYSRNPERAVGRLGFKPDGEVTYEDIPFRRYRLRRSDWSPQRR